MKENAEAREKERSRTASASKLSSVSSSPSPISDSVDNGTMGHASSGWTSWAVEGLSKKIEQAVNIDGVNRPLSSSSTAGIRDMDQSNFDKTPSPRKPTASKTNVAIAEDGWDDFDVDSTFDDGDAKLNSHTQNILSSEFEAQSLGWGDDDWMDELNDKPAKVIDRPQNSENDNNLKEKPGKTLNSDDSFSSRVVIGNSGEKDSVAVATKTSSMKIAKQTKTIGAKKINVDKTKENWDDF